MVSHKCSECVYYTKRKFDLKTTFENVYAGAMNVVAPIKSSVETSQLCDRFA